MKRSGNILRDDKSQYTSNSERNTKIKRIRILLTIFVGIFFTYTLNQSGLLAYFTDTKYHNNAFSIDAQYTITFNSNGGTGTMADQDISYNVSTPLTSNTYTRVGYVFNGWNTNSNGNGTSYSDGASVLNLGDTTLYAQWSTAPTCTVTFDYGDEIFDGTNYINSGIPLFSFNNKTRDFEISTNVSNFVYHSGQEYNRNTIICNQNESGDPYPGFCFQYRESALRIQGNSVQTNEQSLAWGKTSGNIVLKRISNVFYVDNNSLIDFSTMVGTFNAPLSFGANIDNNGNPRRYSTVDLSDITVKLTYYLSEIPSISLPNPTRTGYLFDGWYTQETGGTKITSPTVESLANKRIYAHWIAPSTTHYTIIFDSNSGTGTMSNQVIDYGVPTALTVNTYTKAGATFDGWNTAANGTGTPYSDEQVVTDLGNIVLYAQWLEVPNNVTFFYGDATFDGTNYLDSGIGLFSSLNINRDFVVSAYIDNITIDTTLSINDRNTYITNHNEKKSPWPGFSFIYRDGAIKAQGNRTSGGQAYIPWNQTSGDIVFTRTNKVIYFNNQLLLDFSSYNTAFDSNLVFGANLDSNGQPRRYGFADLNDMSITLKYTDTEINNLTLPTPNRIGYTFEGWYTAETGGTLITNPTPSLLANKTIYAHWTANQP